MRVFRARLQALLGSSVLLLSACGGGGDATALPGGGGGGGGPILEAVSLQSSSSLPLYPLAITVRNASSSAMTVAFSNSAGFSTVTTPLSVTSKLVTVAVPIYIDPATHLPASGKVSVVLSQDGTSTSPLKLTIDDLPSVASYGMSAGQISHAFLIYNQLLLARQLDDLQTMQQAMQGKENPAASISTLYFNLIPAANDMRNDVDLVTNQNQVFAWGSLSSVGSLQFDAAQLDIMDRIVALYLQEQFTGSTAVRRYFARRPASLGGGAGGPRPAASGNTLQEITQFLTVGNSLNELTEEIRKAPSDFAQGGLAVMTGLKMYFDSNEAEDSAALVGSVSSATQLGMAINAQLQLLTPTAECLGSTTCSPEYAAELANQETVEGLNVYKAEVSLLSSINALAGLSDEALSFTSESLQAAASVYQKLVDGGIKNLYDTTESIVTDTSYPDVIENGLGMVSGTVSISNNIGDAAALTALQVQNCAGGCGSYNITTMADPGGSYDLVIPLDISGVDYSNMTVVAYDFATSNGLSSETVDLTGLDTSVPVTVPPMSGTCNDTDYGTPDEDDPDCD